MSVATALEADLEPFAKLRRFELPPNAVTPQHFYMNPQLASSRALHISSFPGLHGIGGAVSLTPDDYTISSNPPNPHTSFRMGDWICRSHKCAAHNFGVLHRRNLTCIGCGCPRAPTSNSVLGNDSPLSQSPHRQHFAPPQAPPSASSSRPLMSPRFASSPMSYRGNMSPTAYGGFAPQSPTPYASSSVMNLPPPASPIGSKPMSTAHPLLTPSGSAFASGGKVQNVSSDPLSPCIMYWPDNEPFPEQGQIRPSGLMGVPQPPILNTGNRGPISHQPGDWICLKCNYLNWRRRKVCQTCLPYAEGNGDSISAAVQAERIALLTSVLAQTRHASPSSVHVYPRAHSTTPAQAHRPFVDATASPPPRAAYRSQSHMELGTQFAHAIYQTPAPAHPHPHPRRYQQPQQQQYTPVDMYAPAPAPLLPSFLQDIVQSPTLSPASTSSADLSFDEYDGDSLPSSACSTFSQDSANTSPLANIWRLDGEESKSLAAFALPARRELVGGRTGSGSSRNSSLERLRLSS
ncbi:hypothetical protein B0H10DRAFT_1026126 [Mycena sp. CBHHK59/15]|nr:hypothetical protein B0H10DRAFT_1026126 [Mycena sp. CBHHK59/15]